jgi:hypothetical protein
MHFAPNQGLKHAARQFGLCDPPADLIQITECGPHKHFFYFNIFHVTALKAQESLQYMVGNVQHTSAKRQKFNDA